MMYCDERQATPGFVDDNSTTRVFLCTRTQEVIGPDGQPVSPADCSSSRECYLGAPRPVMPTIDTRPNVV
jgi:hypothetical protein